MGHKKFWFPFLCSRAATHKLKNKMIRRDTWEVRFDLSNEPTSKDNVFFAEGSEIVFDASIDSGGPANATVKVVASSHEMEFEDEDGNEVELSKEEIKEIENACFAENEEDAIEKAWEERYDDR